MKIRIKDSTVRFRLSKKDLKKLRKKGKVSAKCVFGTDSVFKYSIVAKKKGNTDVICVDLKKNHILVELSMQDVKEWRESDLIGFDAEMDNGTAEGLYILIEKDFTCLKKREGEDESQLYPNPNA